MSEKTLKPDVPKPGLGLPLSILKKAAGGYAKAMGGRAVNRLTDSASSLTDRLTSFAEGGDGKEKAKGAGTSDDKAQDQTTDAPPSDTQGDAQDDGGKSPSIAENFASKIAEGESPVKAGLSALGTGVKDKVKGLFGRGGGKGGGRKKFKFNNIVETFDVGAPVDIVYDAWTTYDQWPDFMKKLERAEVNPDEGKGKFKGQVFWSHREWDTTIKEQVPDRRIVWESGGPKGHISGAVTFHELAEELTRIVVVLEYYPQGFMEKTANIWRAANRRVRLELKLFVRHVMTDTVLHPEDVEGYHAEIHDKEIVRSHDDVMAEREADEEGSEEEGSEEEGTDESEYDDEYAGSEEGAPEGDEYGDDEYASDEDEEDRPDGEAGGDYAEEDYAEEEAAEYDDEGGDEAEDESDEEATTQEPAPRRGRGRR
ncbi:SRPBCC family protein [Puerhibacterium sp. TATVAM-FAB25]|uniref:SRPBCC family protein n=1 Tax=Puerhibacterium sp. TATVAM-FAB25 TaxID=3093699 RepID=UPI00397887A9